MKRAILSAILLLGATCAYAADEPLERDKNGATVCGAVLNSAPGDVRNLWVNSDHELLTTATCTSTVMAGTTAAGAALTVNPVTTGGRAEATEPAAVDDGDVVNDWKTLKGAEVVACFDGTNPQTLKCNTAGNPTIDLIKLNGATISATNPAFVAPSALITGGTYQGMKTCSSVAAIAGTATNGTLKIVTGVSAKKVYICGYMVTATSAVSVNWVEGTGTNCDTGAADVTGAAALAAKDKLSTGLSPYALPFTATNADDLCIKTSGASDIGGVVWYTVQ